MYAILSVCSAMFMVHTVLYITSWSPVIGTLTQFSH